MKLKTFYILMLICCISLVSFARQASPRCNSSFSARTGKCVKQIREKSMAGTPVRTGVKPGKEITIWPVAWL